MSYNWNYTYVGGVPRVQMATGADIAHLDELNEKLWTVLSCPVKGLEIDEKSLGYIDANKDGQVHVTEVQAAAKWLCAVLKDADLLLRGVDRLSLSDINAETAEGKQVLDAVAKVLASLGTPDAQEITLTDTSRCLAVIIEQKMTALKAERAALPVVEPPYGDKTAEMAEVYAALDGKVREHYRRTRLSQYSALVGELVEVPEAAAKATEEEWVEMGAKLAAYSDYVASQNVSEADITIDEETANIQLVDRLLHLTRDFFTLLKNFVTFIDFYNPSVKAIFQAGTLYIDQRACDLCVRVNDAGAMAAQAAASNLFLVFCHCTNKVIGQEMDIVAAVTVGDVSNIAVGKNCIFYDRQGRDWDARVTNVMDNPISIKQAALSPYKKMASFVEDKIRTMAQKKEEGVISNATASIDAKTDSAAAAVSTAPTVDAKTTTEAAKATAGAFDVAKFAGIFAAIGMAIGFIGSFVTTVVTGFLGLSWWQMPLCILAIFLLISGPSMFLAWTKLRKRNLAPVLNANGWAVNAAAMVSIAFGNALTEQAKFPLSAKMRSQDPFADKGMPFWKKCVGYLIVLLICFVVLWYFNAFASIECMQWLPASPYDPSALTAVPDSAATV